jgi:L-lysine exporter family protein LysE/ArgO
MHKPSLAFMSRSPYVGRVIDPVLAGLMTGLSLIVAIGAQNAYVLRQGLLRSHVGSVVAVCAASDLVLIVVGVSGIGTVVQHAGSALQVLTWLGIALLLWYAAGALRRAVRPESFAATGGAARAQSASRGSVAGRAAALTWLNPHVYLDTVLLLGSIATTQYAGHAAGGRWWFAAGAGLASILWFSALGFGTRFLAPVLTRPRAWQVLEFLVALTMVYVAARLARP